MLEVIIILVSILIAIGLMCPIVLIIYLLLDWSYRLEREEKSYSCLEEEYYERTRSKGE